jgi:hypothetical protein
MQQRKQSWRSYETVLWIELTLITAGMVQHFAACMECLKHFSTGILHCWFHD